MSSQEAAAVIRAIAESLSAQPGQFKIEINVTGQKVVSHGGTGLSITAMGGGPGSTTIGQSVSASGGGIEIQQGRHAFDSQLQHLISTLNAIATELEAPSPDKGRAQAMYKSLLGTWVPGVITSVIGNVLGASFGL